MKKKLVSLALALALCLSLAVPALAANPVTLTSGGLRLTIADVLFEEDVTLPVYSWDGKTFQGEETFHIYHIPKAGAHMFTATNHGPTLRGGEDGQYDSSLARLPLVQENGAWKVLEGGGFVDYLEEDWKTGASLDLYEFSGNLWDDWTSGDTLTQVGLFAHARDEGILIYCVIGDQPLAAKQADQPAGPSFTDVKPGDWFADAVKWAVGKGITAGTSKTTFSPGQDCTVAQILTFLWRANGSPKPAGGNPFSDVKDGDWFADAAAWAHEKGMVTGSTFGGSTLCTRSMAVTYMWQAAGSPSAKAADFADVPSDAGCAAAVAWAVEQGVTAGTSETTFSPDNVCTRGQIATFLYRGLAK